MPKQMVSIRLEEDARNYLKDLSESWQVSQAQVVEQLLKEAVREGRQLRPVVQPHQAKQEEER